MELHKNKDAFDDLSALTAQYIGIPVSAVKRDYYIVQMLQNLSKSKYSEECVFKGGTSLSKCYPGSIKRFSEDIDLTFIPVENLSNKKYNKILKQIEKILAGEAIIEKIPEERNDRNKSSYIWLDNDNIDKIKLEIGSSVRPDPYEKRALKTYIQEYLEYKNMSEVVVEFQLEEVIINTLCIERTFLDKIMSVKRHAICGTLNSKVRHIYDVTMLYEMTEIKNFLSDTYNLKTLIALTKETDSYYLKKRNISNNYNPLEPYDFNSWRNKLDENIRTRYEKLHEDLLYTNNVQDFDKAINVLKKIDNIFKSIGE